MFSRSATRLLLTAATLATSALAVTSSQSAIVTIEASHGGAGNGLTNTTIQIPLSSLYTNESVLGEVSSLFLIGSAGGVSLDSITCTPFRFANGTGLEGYSFNSSVPSALSTNTVALGSLLCTTSEIAAHPPVASGSGTTTATSTGTEVKTPAISSSSTTLTNPFVSSVPAGNTHKSVTSLSPSTVTSVVIPKTTVSSAVHSRTPAGDGASGASPSASPTSSAPTSSPTTDTSGGRMLFSSSEFFSGLAVAGLGLAFVL